MLLSLFAATSLAAAPGCVAQVNDATATIGQVNADWVRAMNAGDAAAIAAAYDDEGLFLLPDGEVLRGRAAVEAFYAGRKPQHPMEGAITTLGVACGDDGLLYEWGRGEVRYRQADGTELRRISSYLTVWRKVGADWRIVRNLAF